MAAGLTTSADEDQLLRAHWLTVYDPKPRNWYGSKAIKARFDLRAYQRREEELLGDLVAYTEGLRASCIAFCDARAPQRAEAFNSMPDLKTRTEVKSWSEKLIRTNVIAPFLPLLIATRMRFADDSDKYLQLVKFCETFAFRVYRLLKTRADTGQANLFRIGHQLYNDFYDFEFAMQLLWESLLALNSEASFQSLLQREDYLWYFWGGLKYFLYEYEEHLAAKKGAMPKISWQEVQRRERADTIEHILPQTATDAYWRDRFDEEERESLVHDLGNLTLTKDNSSYSNKPFPAKKGAPGNEKPCYAESPLFMERELASLDDWNPTALVSRRKRLTDWARDRWNVPDEYIATDVTIVAADEEEDLDWDQPPD
jgi:hypothetical protein